MQVIKKRLFIALKKNLKPNEAYLNDVRQQG